MPRNELTIVINTFNSDEKIYSCLDSINPDLKILVIENSNNVKFKESIEIQPVFAGVAQLVALLQSIDGGFCDE